MADKPTDKSLQRLPQPQEVQVGVLVPAELRAPKYANWVNIDTNDDDVTLDFISLNKRDNPQGTVVSRIVISRTMLDHVTETLIQYREIMGTKKK